MSVCCADALPVGAAHAESLQDASKLTTVLPVQVIRVAQSFELQLQVESPEPVLVELTEERKNASGDFEILRSYVRQSVDFSRKAMAATSKPGSMPEQVGVPGRFQTTLVLVLETARAGQRNLPAFSVRVTAGEDVFDLVSEATEVAVGGIVPSDFDPTQFRDLKPLAEIISTDAPVGIGVWLLVPITVLMGVVIFLWRRSGKSEAVIRQRWIAEIDSLENELNNRTMTLPMAHDETCARIRQWIKALNRIPATSLPTDSLIDELQSRSWPQSLLERLSSMLRRNDQLKFSADAERPEQSLGVFDDARWLIRHGMTADRTEANR